MPFSGKRKYPYQFNVYVPPEKEKIVKEFIKLFQARNESASQKLIEYMEDYVVSNRPVNPQKRLNQILQKPAILCDCGEAAEYALSFHRRGKLTTDKVCESCLQKRKRSRQMRAGYHVKKLR